MSGHGPIENHAIAKRIKGRSGRTPAGWTTTWTVLAGAVVMAFAVGYALPWLFWTGLGIAALGVVAGYVLSRRGLGITAGYHQARDTETRDEWLAGDTAQRERSGP